MLGRLVHVKKHVTIRDEFSRIRGRFEQLNVSNQVLQKVCSEYGPGQYRVSWSENELVERKDGSKKRKSVPKSKFVKVYADDGSIIPADRGPVVIQDRRGDMSAFAGFMAEIKSGFDDIRARLDDLETDDEDDDDLEDPPAPIAEPALLEKILTFMRQPKYQPLMDALLIGEEAQQSQRVDAVFAQNPTLPREIVLDLMEMIVSLDRAA